MTTTHKILLCEDDPDVRTSVTMLLQMTGYNVKAVDLAIKVKDMLETFKPDLLLIDLWLPNISGDVCIKTIRMEEKNHLPIILFSANTQVRSIAQECGADDYLIKPFEIEELEQKLKLQLKARQA
ncbi:response regulator transcription factor [Roseivirga sp. BDSF3-8]|uniref:response regulator transcription factor n=1 Tax=Roseivirga sp. BDSF3-8 TaxID=3241598 RepID=UPI003531CD09